jgi:hypothetical protein
MKPTFVALALSLICAAPGVAAPAKTPTNETPADLGEKEYTVADMMRIRCATDGSEAFYEWQGKVFSFVTGEKQRLLFRVIGMNVARCKPMRDGSWLVITREIQLYLDPSTGALLQQWENPWTHETLPVVHVANNPVQNRYPNVPYRAGTIGTLAVFNEDWPLTYPNPLAGNEQFAHYGNAPLYQASEMFKYYAPISAITDTSSPAVTNAHISWTRTGPWLPWMKMKTTPGYLVYSAWGGRVQGYKQLSPLLRREIDTRLPLYQHAPTCWLATKNETSWSYFIKHFDAYLKRVQFPIPAPTTADSCGQEPG